MFDVVLGPSRRQCPNAAFEIDFRPLHVRNFVPPLAGQDQKQKKITVGPLQRSAAFQSATSSSSERTRSRGIFRLVAGDAEAWADFDQAPPDGPIAQHAQPGQRPIGDNRRAPIGNLQAAINPFLDEHNVEPKPFTWTPTPTKSSPLSDEANRRFIDERRDVSEIVQRPSRQYQALLRRPGGGPGGLLLGAGIRRRDRPSWPGCGHL